MGKAWRGDGGEVEVSDVWGEVEVEGWVRLTGRRWEVRFGEEAKGREWMRGARRGEARM